MVSSAPFSLLLRQQQASLSSLLTPRRQGYTRYSVAMAHRPGRWWSPLLTLLQFENVAANRSIAKYILYNDAAEAWSVAHYFSFTSLFSFTIELWLFLETMTSVSSSDDPSSVGIMSDTKSEDDQLKILVKASQLFYSGSYEELYDIISQNQFSEKSKKPLQNYWLQAHYVEAEKIRGKPLGPVEKYRIRKKYPIPETIWDGTNKSHCFQENIRQYLHHQYLKDPYPTSNKKREMSNVTALSIVQVSNWFKNRRQRDRAAIGKSRLVDNFPYLLAFLSFSLARLTFELFCFILCN